MNSDLPDILTSDREFKLSLQQFNQDADKQKEYFESMQNALSKTHHNEEADPVITPTPTSTNLFSGSAILPPSFITREEVEDFKRRALKRLGLDYIPKVLAQFNEGE